MNVYHRESWHEISIESLQKMMILWSIAFGYHNHQSFCAVNSWRTSSQASRVIWILIDFFSSCFRNESARSSINKCPFVTQTKKTATMIRFDGDRFGKNENHFSSVAPINKNKYGIKIDFVPSRLIILQVYYFVAKFPAKVAALIETFTSF